MLYKYSSTIADSRIGCY